MRKIKRITHLRSEKKRLRQQQTELEKQIRNDWRTLRHTFEPAGLAREALSSCTEWVTRKLLKR
ncbi:MAG: hypothetical protein P4L51_26685 [Puia sp.]|nr:hypothetical protein [Puia sp.]